MTCFYTHFNTSALSCATALLLLSQHLEKNKLQLVLEPEHETLGGRLGSNQQCGVKPSLAQPSSSCLQLNEQE